MLTYCGYEYYAYASLFVLRIRLIIFMTSICRVIILCLLLSYIQKYYAYCYCLLLALNVAWEGPLDCTLISQQHALRNNDWTTSYTTAIHMTKEPVSDKNNTKPYCYSCTLMACNSRRSVTRHGARKIQRRLQLRPRASLPLQTDIPWPLLRGQLHISGKRIRNKLDAQRSKDRSTVLSLSTKTSLSSRSTYACSEWPPRLKTKYLFAAISPVANTTQPRPSVRRNPTPQTWRPWSNT